MRSVLALLASSSLGACAWLTVAETARAQPDDSDRDEGRASGLQVAREAEAEGCPDTSELNERVARLRAGLVTSTRDTYLVTFSRQGGVYRAAIRRADGSVRVLTDRGEDCASLAQATAVTVALLLDSAAHEDIVEESAPPRPANVPTATPVRAPPTPPPAPRDEHTLGLAVGGGALFGVVRAFAPAMVAELALHVNRFHGGVGVLWVPTQQLPLAPGQLRETLLSGVARTCYAPFSRKAVRVETCTGIYAGVLRVEARGYTRNDALSRTWLAVPLELSLSTVAPPFGVTLGATSLLPLRQSDFAIDNLGTAYESWPLGMLVTLRASGAWVL
jgi:hypothetical protein